MTKALRDFSLSMVPKKLIMRLKLKGICERRLNQLVIKELTRKGVGSTLAASVRTSLVGDL